MENQYIIKGGTPLKGEVTIGGAKNAALGILAAAIMTDETVTIENLPDVRDINVLLQAIEGIGATVQRINSHTVKINGSTIGNITIDYDSIRKIRASYYLLGALLGKYNKAQVALPGGCDIGSRPIDQHLKGFRALGATVTIEHGMINTFADSLVGNHIFLDVVSVGATINIMLASCMAEGRTVIENAEEAVFEEKKIEEQEVVFLMDRFGYARIVDVAVYERNKEAADSENKYIVHCMNTGKICIFTNSGKMHQVKVIDLPYGKFRDKGVPIDNVSNYSSSDEQIVSVYDSEQMRFAMLLFSTAQGMVKKVSGSEFQVAKRTILATKLQEEDSLVDVRVVNENKHVVLQTKNGYFLRFPATEVPIKKKAAVGVRGIRLQKKDELEKVYLFEEGTETKILYNEKEVSLNRLKTAKRDGAGTKARK